MAPHGLAGKRGVGRKLLLGIAIVATAILFVQVTGTRAQTESQAETTPAVAGSVPTYEVASIKPAKPGSGMAVVMTRFLPNGFTATNVTVQSLIRTVYGVEDQQISGAPRWLTSEKYNIEAKTDSSVADELQKLGRDDLEIVRKRMLQALLADRFKLALHHKAAEGPQYVLVIAKTGPKLHEAKPEDIYANGIKAPNGGPGKGVLLMSGMEGPITSITGQGVPIASLATLLSRQLGRAVLDRTGLIGGYDFTLRWMPDNPLANGVQEPEYVSSPDFSSTSIYTAIQEQLGLRLESTKGAVDSIVIDHVERPSEN